MSTGIVDMIDAVAALIDINVAATVTGQDIVATTAQERRAATGTDELVRPGTAGQIRAGIVHIHIHCLLRVAGEQALQAVGGAI
ncbi:hypothetical protein D3C78_1021920 [compost metagenome]